MTHNTLQYNIIKEVELSKKNLISPIRVILVTALHILYWTLNKKKGPDGELARFDNNYKNSAQQGWVA
jgi:hypothetical protein